MGADVTTDFGLKIRKITGRGGAEVSGINLGPDLQPATIKAIREQLLEHKVIFFRGQHQLTDQSQEAFAKLLGEPVAHPTVPTAENTDYVLELDSEFGGRADTWHTDVTFVDAYPQASILRALTVPEAGGDTIWSNTEAAYEHLPEVLKQLANNLRAIHSNLYDYAARRPKAPAEDAQRYADVFASTIYETEHPVAVSYTHLVVLASSPYSGLLISSLSWRSLIASMVRRSCSAIWLCGTEYRSDTRVWMSTTEFTALSRISRGASS